MKKFLKKNRYTIILLIVFVLLVILGLKVKNILVPDEGKATYGERLKDISKHQIKEEVYKKIEEELLSNKTVTKVSHRLQGKIINYYITFDSKVSVKDAKALGESIIKGFDEDTLGYYSIQIFLLKDDEKQNNFPIIGMRSPESKAVSWTKDREIIVESEKNEE